MGEAAVTGCSSCACLACPPRPPLAPFAAADAPLRARLGVTFRSLAPVERVGDLGTLRAERVA